MSKPWYIDFTNEHSASWLKKHRKEAGLTQDELAEETGLSASIIRAMERGARKGTLETWRKIELAIAPAVMTEDGMKRHAFMTDEDMAAIRKATGASEDDVREAFSTLESFDVPKLGKWWGVVNKFATSYANESYRYSHLDGSGTTWQEAVIAALTPKDEEPAPARKGVNPLNPFDLTPRELELANVANAEVRLGRKSAYDAMIGLLASDEQISADHALLMVKAARIIDDETFDELVGVVNSMIAEQHGES